MGSTCSTTHHTPLVDLSTTIILSTTILLLFSFLPRENTHSRAINLRCFISVLQVGAARFIGSVRVLRMPRLRAFLDTGTKRFVGAHHSNYMLFSLRYPLDGSYARRSIYLPTTRGHGPLQCERSCGDVRSMAKRLVAPAALEISGHPQRSAACV